MVAKSCIICTATKEAGAKLFDAPKEEHLRSLWSTSCGLTITKSSLVCHKHFVDSDYHKSGILKKDAIPKNDLREVVKSALDWQIKEEPMENSDFHKAAVDPLSINASADNIKDEETTLCVETDFNENPNDIFRTLDSGNNITEATLYKKSSFCGRIAMDIAVNGIRTYRLICDQCKNLFPTVETFDDHMNECSSKEILQIYKKNEQNAESADESVENYQLVNTENKNYAKKNEDQVDDYSQSLNLSISDCQTDDETDQPKKKKMKFTTGISKTISFDHSDKLCVTSLLELLKVHAILWLPRQNTRKFFREASSALLEKFNVQYPKYAMTSKDLHRTINRFKDLHQRATKEPAKNSNRNAKINNYPEYLKLCAEIEENSQQYIQKCNLCKAIFYNSEELQIHKYKLHKIGKLPYTCQLCQYGFSSAETLASHEEKHNRTKSFKCEHCYMAFYFESKLQAHMVVHTDDRKPVCEICGKVCPNLTQFRKHKLTHETPKEKCEICGKCFIEKWQVNDHMKAHKNERTYICNLCGKGFNRQKNLYIHKRGVHKMKKTSFWAQCEDEKHNQKGSNSDSSAQNTESISDDFLHVFYPKLPENNVQ